MTLYLPTRRQISDISLPSGVQVNRSHPLAVGLVSFVLPGLRHRYDLITNARSTGTTGAPTYGSDRYGDYLQTNTDNSTLAREDYTFAGLNPNAGTFIVRFNPLALAPASNQIDWPRLGLVTDIAGTSISIISDGYAFPVGLFRYSYTTAFTYHILYSTAVALPTNQLTTYVVTWQISGSNVIQQIYFNGWLNASQTVASPAMASGNYLNMVGGPAQLRAYLTAVYDRVLSANEIAAINAEPYAMLDTGLAGRYWLVIKPAAGGAAIALEGATAGTSTATASLSGTTAALTGTSTAAATASAARLESTKPVTGTAAGTSTTAGTLTNTKPLAGTADGVATASATGLLSTDAIAGQSDGTSNATATGLLSADSLSAATADGTSTATADLTISTPGAVPLVGQTDGAAMATGALINSKPVAGEAAGTSAAIGALSNTKPLTASADGTSGATGSIATDKSMGGSATGLGGLTASLQTALALAGSIAGASSVVGAIGVPIAIIGTADSVGAATGTLGVSALQLTELGTSMASGNKLMSTGSLMRSVR